MSDNPFSPKNPEGNPWLASPATSAISWAAAVFTAVAAVAALASGKGFMASVLGFWPIEAFRWAAALGWEPALAGFLFYQFLHGGAIHLYMNVAALRDLWTYVERSVGTKNFLLLFAVSWVVTYAVSVATYADGTAMAGVSGFVFAVGWFLIPFGISSGIWKRFWGAVAIVFALNFAISMALPFVSLTAHAVGFLSGMAFYGYFRYRYGKKFFRAVSALMDDARTTRHEAGIEKVWTVFFRTLVGLSDRERFADRFETLLPRVTDSVSERNGWVDKVS